MIGVQAINIINLLPCNVNVEGPATFICAGPLEQACVSNSDVAMLS